MAQKRPYSWAPSTETTAAGSGGGLSRPTLGATSAPPTLVTSATVATRTIGAKSDLVMREARSLAWNRRSVGPTVVAQQLIGLGRPGGKTAHCIGAGARSQQGRHQRGRSVRGPV